MANKLTKLTKSETVGISINQNSIILKREIFPANIDAGMIDAFIESVFPDKISRDPNGVNGVSGTPTEIVITLKTSLSDAQINPIISALENRAW